MARPIFIESDRGKGKESNVGDALFFWLHEKIEKGARIPGDHLKAEATGVTS